MQKITLRGPTQALSFVILAKNTLMMNGIAKILFLFFASSLLGSAAIGQQMDKFGGDLRDALLHNPSAKYKAYALLEDRVDVRALEVGLRSQKASVETRAVTVVTRLQDKAAATQPAFLELLQSTPGVDDKSLQAFWITNIVFFEAEGEALLRLSEQSAIAQLGLNYPVYFERAEEEDCPLPLPAPDGIEPGLAAIHAPAMWAKGYTGYGRRLLVVDTGTEPDHPALLRQFLYHNRPANRVWAGNTPPEDCDGHGTHVAGTSLGLDRLTNDTIGVAFDANWMSGVALSGDCTGSTDAAGIFGMLQWSLNPDGDPNTTDDIPDVINNSWRSGSSQCDADGVFELYDALYAAGIAVVFSAGNDGPEPSTITPPKFNNWDLVRLFSVGNLNANTPSLPISSGSSRGPSICGGEGSLLIKPEVSAPGSSVRSAYLGGSYQNLSGTSMAAPHVSGAILLLKQAFPYLAGEDLMLALYFSATDLGEPGEDNTYGMGIINVPAAFDYLVQQGHTPEPPLTAPNDVRLLSLESPQYNCGNTVQLSARVENAGTDTLTSLQLSYSLAGTEDEYEWQGTLLPGERLFIELPGLSVPEGEHEAEVAITLANGQPDARSLDNNMKLPLSVLSEIASPAQWEGDLLCEGGTGILRSAYEGAADIRWYDAPQEGNLLGSGAVLLLEGLQSSMTAYSEVSPRARVGKSGPDGSTNISDQQRGLRFNVYHPCRLLSVKVYAEEAGGRFLNLVRPDGSILSRIVQITSPGEHELSLGINLDPGEGYLLRLQGGKGLRLSSGGNLGYPFEVPGVMEITTSSLGTSAYFYFYDWEVQYAERCGRAAVDLLVAEGDTASQLSIIASADTLDLALESGSISFESTAGNASSWHWDFGDGNTATGATVEHAYTQPGTYLATHWTENATGCTHSAARTVVVEDSTPSSASQAVPAAGRLLVFPNPTTGQFFLSLKSASPQQARILLTDLLGRPLITQERRIAPHETTELNLAAWPSGIYILTVQLEDGSKIAERVVKVK